MFGERSISEIMTSEGFKKITEILHCNNNAVFPRRYNPVYDKNFKLKPIITHLNEKCQNVYNTSSNLDVDESMIQFKGRSSFKQYMPMKPIKRGYKVWGLAESKTGYILQNLHI